jgi:hypothetical protein
MSWNINHFGSTKKNLPFYFFVKMLDNKNKMNTNTTGSLSTTKLTSLSWVNNASFTISTTIVKERIAENEGWKIFVQCRILFYFIF